MKVGSPEVAEEDTERSEAEDRPPEAGLGCER